MRRPMELEAFGDKQREGSDCRGKDTHPPGSEWTDEEREAGSGAFWVEIPAVPFTRALP